MNWIGRAIFGAVVGALAGWVVQWVGQQISLLSPAWFATLFGAFLGLSAGLQIFPVREFICSLRRSEWRVTEIELQTLGQKWKLANSGSQRRVAWLLFVELATRIATQRMDNAVGDDGAALKSLYDLFRLTRQAISDMAPSVVLPSTKDSLDTVETYALAMLNQDLRPFLSKWHPRWELWSKANPNDECSTWEDHHDFRSDLGVLQNSILERAKGLAAVAGVSDTTRFLPPTSCLEKEEYAR